MSKRATFSVGSVAIHGDAILSPMAGYSDVPYRMLCRSYGSAMGYTEFVPVEALLGKRVNERFRRRLDKGPSEHPVIFQIFGNDAQMILAAAQRIEPWGPAAIDINMGCSTAKVSGRGAGVGMMPQPELVEETFSLLSSHLSVPVTGKIRLGWDEDQRNYANIARIMQDNGAALIAMHARTKVQRYGGRADWAAIARLREAVTVPVIGNGDVTCPEDVVRMKAQTGCDAVMIGRAAIGNPWIFAGAMREAQSLESLLAAVRFHADQMIAYYGEKYGLLQFRKHLKRYLSGIRVAPEIMKGLLGAETQVVLEGHLARLEHAAEGRILQPVPV